MKSALGFENTVEYALSHASNPARFEQLEPGLFFDGAHNPQGITASVESLLNYFDEKVYILTGVLKDKDYLFIASELSKIAEKAFTITPDNPRALSAKDFLEVLEKNGVSSKSFESIKDAFESAKKEASQFNKPLIILGSLYTYASL